MKYQFLVLFCIIIFTSFSHPVHVSLTNIEFDEDKKSFDVIFKLFTDDFQDIIAKKYNYDLNFNDSTLNHEKIISKYIFSYFSLTINTHTKKAKKYRLKKITSNNEAVWVHYQIKSDKNLKEIKFTSKILMDLYPDQTNLVFFSYKNKTEAFRFDSQVNQQAIRF